MNGPLILPADRYLAEMLGISIEQLEEFKREVRRRNAQGPQPAVVADFGTLAIIAIVATVLQVGFAIAASFFKPRTNKPAEIKSRQKFTQNITTNERFAPRFGFDALQDIATLGSPIPLVYTLRETISSTVYGGVRVNTMLLWSQIRSLGGSQLLRALFLVGQGSVPGVDSFGFAIGNNAITNYDLGGSGANSAGSRVSIYYKADGGRIVSGDNLVGRSAANDLGNAQNDGGSDVFSIQSVGGSYAPDFCTSSKPTTSTVFGLYSPMGNNLAMKLNPTVRPGVIARLKPKGKKGNSTVVCDVDRVVDVQRQKYAAVFSCRSGITSGSFGLGNTFTYTLDRSSEYLTTFQSVEEALDPWTADTDVELRPVIYKRGTQNRITGFGFADRLTVSGVSVAAGGDGLEVTATFDAETVLAKLIADEAARGQYKVEYWVRVKNNKETIESRFDVTITIQSEKKFTATSDGSGSNFNEYTVGTTTNGEGLVTDVTLSQSGSGSVTVNTTINDDGYDVFISFDADVDKDSGPVTSLTSPLRLQSLIFFPIKELDAYSETAGDIASSVAGRQRAWDDALTVGDLYKTGSALAVCTGKTPDDAVFLSDSEDEASGFGQSIAAAFEVVRAGTSATVSLAGTLQQPGTEDIARETATSGPHLAKVAIATVTTTTECEVIELGFRSSMGTRIQGLCNFRDTLTLEETDGRACILKEGDLIKRGKQLKVDQFQSGIISASEERYSFHRISFREASSTGAFTELDPCFGFRGLTQQNTYNYLRLQMPKLARWEIRVEPLSGWEIRSDTATGPLRVLDSKLSTIITGTSNGVTWTANGEGVSRVRSNMLISTTKRPDPGMGLPRLDENNYLDAWGKLAEMFAYEEVQTSAEGAPEHEIVYINEIRQNAATPNYDGLAIVGVNVLSSVEWQQFTQFSAYVNAGLPIRRLRSSLSVGSSHLFPDILLDILTNTEYGAGSVITDDMIDLTSFADAAEWCYTRKYFYDGVLIERVNIRQWAADTAAAHLLEFGERDGKFYLKPAITFSALPISGLFTAGNILENSFRLRYIDPEERELIKVSIKYREERANSEITNQGLFPTNREVLITETGTPANARVEQIDASDFCTTRTHAIDVAKYIIRMRHIPTHVIQFSTTHEGALTTMGPGDYIRVAMDTTQYDEINNGVVTDTGNLVSTKALSNGSYSVIAWDGEPDTVPADTTLVVSNNGKTATPVGVVFTIKNTASQTRTYQIQRITPNEDGSFSIEALHMPTTEAGIMEVANGFDTAGNWVIEG